ncbi:MAG: SGNH/GDSL hydrolase family protein [Candidatus Sumerlaeia bacterium]
MTRVKPPRPSRRRRLFWAVYAVFILLLVEAGLRLIWMGSGLVTFTNVPRRLYWVFYPELNKVILNDITEYDADYKILLLGGSSVMPQWGAIEQVLRERLTGELGRPVRIDNLGGEGHTTRDSLVKYRLLNRHRYDLVIVYDGINDCRTNNVPSSMFKPDYSHYAWYSMVNREEKVGPRRISVIPFTIGYVTARFFGGKQFLPVDRPAREMLRYGDEIKSRGPFKDNLAEILKIAGERNEPVMLLTFAYHIPLNYDADLFQEKMLDYTLHSVGIQLWGAPTFIAKGIAAHNEAVRELARENPRAPFVDIAGLIPREGRYFNDICHLTVAGSEAWVDNVMPPVLELFKKKDLPPPGTKNAKPIDPDKIDFDL